MTGFDSEADRRDAIRKQIVDKCVFTVRESIRVHGATGTPQEWRWLEVTVARALLKGVELELRSETYRQEIQAAEKEIDK